MPFEISSFAALEFGSHLVASFRMMLLFVPDLFLSRTSRLVVIFRATKMFDATISHFIHIDQCFSRRIRECFDKQIWNFKDTC